MTRHDAHAWLAVPLVVRGALHELEAAVAALAAREELTGRVAALERELASARAHAHEAQLHTAASQGACARGEPAWRCRLPGHAQTRSAHQAC